ncbi:thiol-disulfide oxidoreductase DCC family protein [Pelagibius litoralis]|uniref:Thiol-disulfide oxidoreductase DCC family protein n=1 Tax=Pelagibius litoralis TaxID=374515 RepID=A0A967C482_9PROT|nr:thiol-disulfide oxidoreductase DCC family protein [Pelagibius litoralis]
MLFDGVCVLCNGSMQFVLRHERMPTFHFAPIQSPPGRQALIAYGQAVEDWDSVVVIDDGTVYLKSDAALRIARGLKAPWSWLTILRVLPRGLRDWFYDRVARNRYRLFGRYDHCMVPGPDLRRRFLS